MDYLVIANLFLLLFLHAATLVEGVPSRSTERMTGIRRETIMRLMCRVGQGCANLMDSYMKNL